VKLIIYLFIFFPQIFRESLEEKKKNYRFSSFKRIDHPRFRLASASKAAHELKHGNIGEALITPLEKSQNEYILTIKVCTDPVMMKTVHIQENYSKQNGIHIHILLIKFH
jgi:hypothetical protein